MKKITFFTLLMLSASSLAANPDMDTVKFDCPDLAFTLNLSTNTVTFTNIRYFGIAEMITNTPIGFSWGKKNTVKIEYNWYYTTEIDIHFPKKMYEMETGKQIDIVVNFDDNDGISNEYDNNKRVTCKVI